ncbi:hypothetical protein [Crenothrix polyspora]|nr:hypothetical protein [Crenothrix polyspora]
MNIEPLAEVSVRQLSKFLKFIAQHNQWDELEQHLRDQGCNKLLMSWEPIHAVATIVETKSHELASFRIEGEDPTTMMKCASNGTGRPPPNTPDGGG